MTRPEPGRPFPFYDTAAFAFDPDVAIALIADLQIRQAIERGEFDDLPGAGKPLDLSDRHDPDWWFKSLVRREGLVMLPPSIQLRKDDAALDDRLDGLPNETAVRREVEKFNERVIRARYEPPAGPPLVTMPRDVDATVAAWADRKTTRAEEARRKPAEDAGTDDRSESVMRRTRPRGRRHGSAPR